MNKNTHEIQNTEAHMILQIGLVFTGLTIFTMFKIIKAAISPSSNSTYVPFNQYK